MASGAGVQSKKGERVSISLILRNGSTRAVRSSVKRIARLDDTSEVPLRLTWQQIEPGGDRHFNLDTPPLEVGGSYTFTAMVVISIAVRRHRGELRVPGIGAAEHRERGLAERLDHITVLGDISGHECTC